MYGLFDICILYRLKRVEILGRAHGPNEVCKVRDLPQSPVGTGPPMQQ